MINIPTAKEKIKNTYYITDIMDVALLGDKVAYLMVEFAKTHVKAALKEASEKANTLTQDNRETNLINRKSILNAYPLENIK